MGLIKLKKWSKPSLENPKICITKKMLSISNSEIVTQNVKIIRIQEMSSYEQDIYGGLLLP